ncbi:MAG: hypothetical protein IPP46_14280 [Bacteroidetes bacterium]|nr:hypothetical protein [Bacteroidota bacterium]
MLQDAGAGPGRDVMAGLEKLKATGMIDNNNIGVSGLVVRWFYDGMVSGTLWRLESSSCRCSSY